MLVVALVVLLLVLFAANCLETLGGIVGELSLIASLRVFKMIALGSLERSCDEEMRVKRNHHETMPSVFVLARKN